MRLIGLANNKGRVIVDDIDFCRFGQFRWCLCGPGYAGRSMPKSKTMVLMHRLVIGAGKGEIVDHINGNKLDNRRSNLRICNSQQNIVNSKIYKTNSSGYRGVSWDAGSRKWRAAICVNGKRKYLGVFSNKEDAARCYDMSAITNFGLFATINFPYKEYQNVK